MMEKKVGGRVGTFVADEVGSLDIWESVYKTLYDPASPGKDKSGSVVFVGTGGDQRKTGPGLFEYLKDGNTIPYSPGDNKEYKEYELTPEEHAKFDALPGLTKEEIETAKKVLAKTLSKEVSSIDQIATFMEKTWYEDKSNGQRTVHFQVGAEGQKLLKQIKRAIYYILKG